MPCCSQISKGYLTRTPGVKQASYGSLQHVHLELGNSQTAHPLRRDARMPACRREGGGDVVIECFPVMGKTR